MAEAATLPQAATTTVIAQPPFSVGPHLLPEFDPIELLPERAQDRLRKLRLRKADAHRLIPEFETIREASMARVEAETALKRLTDHQSERGHNLPPTHALVIEAQRHLDKMTADFKRLTELREVRSAAFQSAGAALANVEAWLKSGRPGNTTLEEEVAIEPPKLLKGESVLDAVERLRRRGRELRADAHRVESSCFPSNFCKKRMREMVEQLAQIGTPDCSSLIEFDRDITWPTQRVQSEVHNVGPGGAIAFAEVHAVLPLLAFLLKPTMISALDALIDAESDDASSLSHEDRAVRIAEIQGDLVDTERQEASLVFAAWEHGLACEHRSDCSPLALLGLQLRTEARATELPATSAGYSWPMRR